MAITRIRILGALVTTAVVVAGCLGGDDSDKVGGEKQPDAFVLTLANHEPNNNDLAEFARGVARQSNGSVRIEFKNRWRDGSVDYEPQTIEDVRDGKVDLAQVSARAFDVAGVNSFQPLVAPFAVDSYALERRVLSSPLAARMLRGVEQLDLVGIGLVPGEMRKPLGITRALVEASDYGGATIGTRRSRLGGRTFRALGASPEYYEPGGDISSFDGADAGLGGIEGDRLDGPARTLAANVNLWPRVIAIVMNRDAYDELSGDQRDALEAASRAALDPTIERLEHVDEEAMGVLCNRRQIAIRSASRSQLDALRGATSPVSRALERDPATRDAAEEIAALHMEVKAEPAPGCAAHEHRRTTGKASQLDGLWSMDTTADELAEISPPGDVAPENWGEFIVALLAGRFAFTNENSEACIWGHGSYELNGNILDWSIEDGGGKAPTDAANRPGEFFRFRWSRYRDQLRLTGVKGAISPEGFRVKPWRLLDGEPSLDALSPRCRPPADALQP
jgi:TRAP-type C4-dicarboxylate transport system substrate-binding protein